MTTFKAAEQWGVSISVARDRARIIPLAEKKAGIWNIPEDIECPPISSRKAYILMTFLTVYNEGGRPNYSRTGIKLSDIEHGYKYLTDCGYITGRPGEVTTFGKKLMKELERQLKITGKVGNDVASIGVENG